MSDAAALPSIAHPGKVTLCTDADREGIAFLTPDEARALAVDLEQAAFDVEQDAPAPAAPEVAGGAPCAYCYGTGRKRLTAAEFVPCWVCGGSGSVPEVAGGVHVAAIFPSHVAAEVSEIIYASADNLTRFQATHIASRLEQCELLRAPPAPVAAAAPEGYVSLREHLADIIRAALDFTAPENTDGAADAILARFTMTPKG